MWRDKDDGRTTGTQQCSGRGDNGTKTTHLDGCEWKMVTTDHEGLSSCAWLFQVPLMVMRYLMPDGGSAIVHVAVLQCSLPSSEHCRDRLGCPPAQGQGSHPSMPQCTPPDPSPSMPCRPADWSIPLPLSIPPPSQGLWCCSPTMARRAGSAPLLNDPDWGRHNDDPEPGPWQQI
jgi:hypothetical protein